MPLIVEENLPAKKILKEEDVFIMGKNRAESQDIRPVNIAILNLMPNKEETEIQLLRALSNTPLQINIDLIRTGSYKSKNTDEIYLKKFYKNFNDIKDKKYDGMIITGAPIEKLEFEDVLYWSELEQIFDYARENVYSTLFICWASQAALYYYYNIPKYTSNNKIFGIYDYKINGNSLLTKGFDDIFNIPQSRYTYTKSEDLEAIEDLEIICSREDTGVCLAATKDNRFVFVSGHGEYDRDSLLKEYKRDIDKGIAIEKPYNYFDNEDNIIVNWRAHGNLLYTNWLNYCVYQDTPYNIENIKGKKVIKFGGSSLSDSNQFIKVKNIVESEQNRNLVVVSAPGKRFKDDIKITDLLIKFYHSTDNDLKTECLHNIKNRYHSIIEELQLDNTVLESIENCLKEVELSEDFDFVLSRGEYLSGIIMAEFLNYEFLDPKDIIYFNVDSSVNYKKTYDSIRKNIIEGRKYDIPGFYGQSHDNKIKVFQRGGSDITGSLIAHALDVEIYENWTDVDGLMNKDPNIYNDVELLEKLSYDDFLKISLNGDQIYNIDAIGPVMETNIPINIRNTNNPNTSGTLIID